MTGLLTVAGGGAGLALLYYGAEFLIRGGVGLARIFRVPPLVIGLTLVAFGTSAPELVVSIDAALRGSGDISVGNVVGSNICNIALILGLCAVIAPLKGSPGLFRRDLPTMVAVTLLLIGFLGLTGGIDRIEAGVLLVVFCGYMTWQVADTRRGTEPLPGDEELRTTPAIRWYVATLLAAGGLLALIIGAKLFVEAAIFIARRFEVPEAVIGLTVVAVGTSLPELATSLVAAIRREHSIAIGNIIGSNIFNILVILGLAPMVRPLRSSGITPVDLGVLLLCSALIWPLLKSGGLLSRLEGLLLLVIYIGYTGYLVAGAL